MQEPIYCVYKHTNKTNGKVYVGMTKNLQDRWSRQGNRYDSCSYFYKAIQKYGWDGFIHEVIEDHLTLDEANERERYWIDFYDSRNKEKGYNLLAGGNTGEMLPETRKKMSESRIAYLDESNIRRAVRCVETGELFTCTADAEQKTGILKSQIFQCCDHKPSAFTAKGYHWVYETEMPDWTPTLAQLKIQEIESFRGGSEEDKQKAYIARVTAKGKKVLCIELNKIFLSAREASRELNIDSSRISKVCRGQAKSAGGYHWQYIEEE